MASTALRCASRRSFDCAENETGFDEDELAEKMSSSTGQVSAHSADSARSIWETLFRCFCTPGAPDDVSAFFSDLCR